LWPVGVVVVVLVEHGLLVVGVVQGVLGQGL